MFSSIGRTQLRKICGKFMASYCPRQNWSLPDSIIYYITQKPSSSKSYQQMVRSCKYFFIKNPITVVEELSCHEDEWIISLKGVQRRRGNISTTSKKLWVTNVFGNNYYLSKPLISKLYRIDAKSIHLFNQIMFLNRFLFYSSNAEHINLIYVMVKDQDKSNLSLEDLVKYLSKVKRIEIDDYKNVSSFTKNTVKKLLEIPHFANVTSITFNRIPETFDIETFFTYIKKHKKIGANLNFDDSISEAYKNRLETIIDEIIATKNHDYNIPRIKYQGQNNEKLSNLFSIWLDVDFV